MKKNLFMTAAAIAALLTGCSTDEEIANIETSAKNAIGFNIVSNKAETKATPIRPDNITSTDFAVFAFNSTTKDLFMGDDAGADGVQIKHNGTSWIYATPSELAYWPTNNLDFYAVNPAIESFEQFTNGMLVYTIKADTQTIQYTIADEFGENEGHKNIDVMYAVAKNRAKTENNGTVKLHFKHTLSQVLFNAKVQYANMNVTIKSMKIHNFAIGGTFTFPTTGEATKTDWASTRAKTAKTVKNEKTSQVVVNSAENPVDITDIDNPMLFIPQTLTPWDTSISKGEADKEENKFQSYLEVDCKIEQKEATAYEGTLYIPFGAEWQPGKRYTYTLIFGGGYDDQGKPILTPITFEPSVENWEDASRYTEQVPAYTN